jgi:hypothetical protein
MVQPKVFSKSQKLAWCEIVGVVTLIHSIITEHKRNAKVL